MKYQIKEALDQVSSLIPCCPNSLHKERIRPNHIHLAYTNEQGFRVDFIYTSGKLYLLRDGVTVGIDSGQDDKSDTNDKKTDTTLQLVSSNY